jgi:hypothetical protein
LINFQKAHAMTAIFGVDQDTAQIVAPQAPLVTTHDIWAQFKIDIAGKEVQTAETYSHSWIANQFGHVCLGIIVGSALGIIFGGGASAVCAWLRLPNTWHLPLPWDSVAGSVIAAILVSWWEWSAFRKAVKEADGHQFPLDRKLLRDNAVVAAAYMILGGAIAFVYGVFSVTPGARLGVPNVAWGALGFAGIASLGVGLAVPWLRQKIIWQRAGLPYLFRLADARPTLDPEDAGKLQRVIDGQSPPEGRSCQIVLGGPISSGRTQFCAGIGTEFAFRKVTVRYLSFATLLEFAARSEKPRFLDDPGPENIHYWPWSTAQVVIIDDIGPLLTTNAQNNDDLVGQFRLVLAEQLRSIRAVLARCHTVWVLGDAQRDGRISEKALNDFAFTIKEFCNARPNETLVVELEPLEPARSLKLPRVRRTHYL